MDEGMGDEWVMDVIIYSWIKRMNRISGNGWTNE